ncbi:MAG: carbamoyltransferase [Proteobacteria bacterium]|nr:carbamoyltransferase [Pseudomonadota bacterium]
MRVLGISDHYISGAALIEDGRLVAAVNEERLVRKKMAMGFPRRSIAEVLRIAGVAPSEVDVVAVASKWGHFLDEIVDFSEGVFGVDEGGVKNLFFAVGSRLAFLRSRLPILESLYYRLREPVFAKRRRRIREVLRDEFDLTAHVEYIWHHRAHAAVAYYGSGFGDALVVTLDGSGDGHSSHVYEVRGGQWRLLHTVSSFDGLGNYYGYVTNLCGFKTGKHEGKVTGLAAYGEDRHREVLESFIRYAEGSMTNVGNAFRGGALEKLRKALPADFRREDLAASIQNLSEDIATRFVGYWQEKTGLRDVALAGGVVANVKINQRIHELPGVDRVFVCPAMSDEGLSAGAALMVSADRGHVKAGRRCFDHVYLGPEYSDREVAEALDAADVAYTRSDDPEGEVAHLLSEGYVVARHAGRMEFGPRALGNRSILYRPDDPAVNDWLNERLQRTEFMPFAPSTLAEAGDSCFIGMAGAHDAARFMTITFDCTDEMAQGSPGVVHIDQTARPQLVSEADNPSYYRIISEFRRRTGLPGIVNTSFNIHEEPIVCTPQDAIRAFQLGHLDVLAIGSFIAKGKDADARVRASRKRSGSA